MKKNIFKSNLTFNFLTSRAGNMFIRATSGEVETCFCMNEHGDHLEKTKSFFSSVNYGNAQKSWNVSEEVLPMRHYAAALAILKKHKGLVLIESGELVPKEYAARPTTFSLSDAFAAAGIRV